MGVAYHVLGVMRFQEAACNNFVQNAFAHIGVHCSDGALVETSRYVINSAMRHQVGLHGSSIDALR
jgi:hypothetical protein